MSESQPVTRYPSFRPSADAMRLFHFLEESEEGIIIKYTVLSAIIDRDVQGPGRRYMYTALSLMRREHDALFGVIPNVGLIRLRNNEKQSVVAQRVRRAHGQVRRGLRDARTVDYAELSDSEKTVHNVTLSVLGALNHFAAPGANRRLMPPVAAARKAIGLNELVSLFDGKKKG